MTEFLYAKYNIASLADLKDNGMYAGNHTGVNMTMDIVNNYNMEELHQYLQQAMRKEFGVRMSFLSHIMRIMPYHQYLEFDGFNLIHDPKIQNYTAVGLWFLNSNKKDEIVFLDQHKKMQLAKNMIVIVDKNPMMSFQIKSKRNEPIYVVVLYYY